MWLIVHQKLDMYRVYVVRFFWIFIFHLICHSISIYAFAVLFSMLSALPCTPWINSAMKLTKYGRFLWAHIQPWIFYTFFFLVCLMDLDIKSTGISQTVWYVWESTVQNEVFISVNLMFGVCQIYWKMGSYTVWVTKESYHPSSTPMVSFPWMCSLNW